MAAGSKGKGRVYPAGQFYKKGKRTNWGIRKIQGGCDQIKSREESAKLQRRHPKTWKGNFPTKTEDWLFKNCYTEDGHWWMLCQQMLGHEKWHCSEGTPGFFHLRASHWPLSDRWCETGTRMCDVPFRGDVCSVHAMCSSGCLQNM